MTVRGAKGRWAKGHTGNPKGGKVTTAADLEAKDKARRLAPEAIDTAVAIMRDVSAAPRDRLLAIKEILDRGLGRPRQELEHSGSVDVGRGDLLSAVEQLAERIAEKEQQTDKEE